MAAGAAFLPLRPFLPFQPYFAFGVVRLL
jgi:hypothetical protein